MSGNTTKSSSQKLAQKHRAGKPAVRGPSERKQPSDLQTVTRVGSAPIAFTPANDPALQRTVGNRVITHLIQTTPSDKKPSQQPAVKKSEDSSGYMSKYAGVMPQYNLGKVLPGKDGYWT